MDGGERGDWYIWNNFQQWKDHDQQQKSVYYYSGPDQNLYNLSHVQSYDYRLNILGTYYNHKVNK